MSKAFIERGLPFSVVAGILLVGGVVLCVDSGGLFVGY